MTVSPLLQPNHRILIVGAGIAGLTLASGLIQQGVRPTVVEIRPDSSTEGVGLILWSNALTALQPLGLDQAVIAAGIIRNRVTLLDGENKIRAVDDLTQVNTEIAPNLGILRAALVHALIPKSELDLRRGLSVEQLTPEAGGVSVQFTDSSSERFDFVIGADGLNSRVRSLLFPTVQPVYVGVNAWRALVPRTSTDDPEMVVRQKAGRHGITIPVSKTQIYVSFHRPGVVGRGLSTADHFAYFRELCADFGGDMTALPDRLTEPEQVVFNPIYELPQTVWYHDRIVLIGDAAHAMPPDRGLGASTALEDVAVLLDALAGSTALDEAFARYRERRQPRVEKIRHIVRASGMIGGVYGPKSDAELMPHRRVLADREAVRDFIVKFSVD